MADEDMVTVPRVLLAAVLDQAESDNFSVEGEFAVDAADHEQYAAERARINELRKLADLDRGDVTGQGFFGVAITQDKESK